MANTTVSIIVQAKDEASRALKGIGAQMKSMQADARAAAIGLAGLTTGLVAVVVLCLYSFFLLKS